MPITIVTDLERHLCHRLRLRGSARRLADEIGGTRSDRMEAGGSRELRCVSRDRVQPRSR